jgi:hypothetical protein
MTNEQISSFLRSPEVQLEGWTTSAEHMAGVGRILEALEKPNAVMSDAGRDATGGYPFAPEPVPKLGYMQVDIIWRTMFQARFTPRDVLTEIEEG